MWYERVTLQLYHIKFKGFLLPITTSFFSFRHEKKWKRNNHGETYNGQNTLVVLRSFALVFFSGALIYFPKKEVVINDYLESGKGAIT